MTKINRREFLSIGAVCIGAQNLPQFKLDVKKSNDFLKTDEDTFAKLRNTLLFKKGIVYWSL